MRLSSKPISSPGRLDKFPPPLTRFLRSNVENRSRGRSRSSPMFVRKKNASATGVETQEPSSPKVTCIGQVRVRRSKHVRAKPAPAAAGRTSTSTTTTGKRRFRWIRKALTCNSVRKIKPRSSSSPAWRKWFLFLQVGYRREVDSVKDSAMGESKREETNEDSDKGDEDDNEEEEEEEEEAKVFVPSTPPKNALLLIRSRSAPYRTSSLANRFWGSPSPIEDPAKDEEEEQERPTLGKEMNCRDLVAESRKGLENEGKLGFSDGFESSSSERSIKTIGTGDVSLKLIGGGGSDRPLVLTRCKSEPARRTGRLDSELSFSKKRRLRFGERYPPHVHD